MTVTLFHVMVRTAACLHLVCSGAMDNQMGLQVSLPVLCYSKAEERLSEKLQRGGEIWVESSGTVYAAKSLLTGRGDCECH